MPIDSSGRGVARVDVRSVPVLVAVLFVNSLAIALSVPIPVPRPCSVLLYEPTCEFSANKLLRQRQTNKKNNPRQCATSKKLNELRNNNLDGGSAL
ncbi:hypothetical protein EVAR_68701_1 [Eumeta japonica]|uniref:Uncharacterized protein n=1 Tax=Eumeta variegata TaxID=151549 RepID=A0A4C2A518_EUMVA|nr:hypothetical protein EVAR_68701_1 [Eumeta japonica]